MDEVITLEINPIERRSDEVAKFLSAAVLFVGILALAGWIFDIEAFKSIIPGMVAIKANTALCFIAIGIALGFHQWMSPKSESRDILMRLSAAFVFLVGFLTLYEYLSGHDLGIDQFLFKEAENAIFTSSPGRMAFNTAINFVFSGAAIFFLDSKKTAGRWIIYFSAFFIFFTGFFSFVGYIYDANPIFIGLNFSTAMALQTMVAFIFTGVSILLSTSGNLMRIVTDENISGRIFRNIQPVVFLLPLVLGFMELKIVTSGSISYELGVMLGVLFNVFAVFFYILFFVLLINKEDTKRRQAELRITTLFKGSQDALMTLEPPSWRFTSGNPAALKLFNAKDENEFLSAEPWKLSPKTQPDGRLSSEKAMEMIEIAMREGSNYFEWTHSRLHDGDFPATVLLSKVKLGDKQFLQATVRDISKDLEVRESLKNKYQEAEVLNTLMVNRELKMIELKKEIQELKGRLSDKSPKH